MKNLLAVCICAGILVSFTGCTPGTIISQYMSTGDTENPRTTNTPSETSRVYMDEVRGTLQNFTGNQVTVASGDTSYVFDISQASVECSEGLLYGENICVIYEGQLQNEDTSTVHALKVVDDYPQETPLEEKTIKGKLQSLTANSITIKTKDNRLITCPVTGTEQYYQKGIKANKRVYLHYKGDFVSSPDNPAALYGTQSKIISVSDTEPLAVPAPTPTPAPVKEQEIKKESQMRGTITNIQLNVLTVTIEGTDTSLSLNMTGIPCYFKGGPAVGSHVTITYTGDFNGTTTDGITLLGLTGETPDNSRRTSSFTVSGNITASTANTITLITGDGMYFTCYTEKASNTSTGGLLTGSSVRITFSPDTSLTTNIYTALTIEDA